MIWAREAVGEYFLIGTGSTYDIVVNLVSFHSIAELPCIISTSHLLMLE